MPSRVTDWGEGFSWRPFEGDKVAGDVVLRQDTSERGVTLQAFLWEGFDAPFTDPTDLNKNVDAAGMNEPTGLLSGYSRQTLTGPWVHEGNGVFSHPPVLFGPNILGLLNSWSIQGYGIMTTGSTDRILHLERDLNAQIEGSIFIGFLGTYQVTPRITLI